MRVGIFNSYGFKNIDKTKHSYEKGFLLSLKVKNVLKEQGIEILEKLEELLKDEERRMVSMMARGRGRGE